MHHFVSRRGFTSGSRGFFLCSEKLWVSAHGEHNECQRYQKGFGSCHRTMRVRVYGEDNGALKLRTQAEIGTAQKPACLPLSKRREASYRSVVAIAGAFGFFCVTNSAFTPLINFS